ncbi:MAG: hypothetical protein K9W42_00075 [Candidatus Heimdallarchaeota archaeon]|nr:hypothetical protein [Candidatus Heimdallarchaeota archaeon]
METDNFVTNSLLHHLFNQSKYLDESIKELLYEARPQERIVDILKTLRAIVAELKRELLKLNKVLLKQTNDSLKIENSIRLYSLAFAQIFSYLKLFALAQEKNVPQAIVDYIDSLTTNFRSESNFILIPDYNYNYYYIWFDKLLKNNLKFAIDDIDHYFPKKNKDISLLGYPHLYKNNILMLGLLGHEIGHFIEFRNQITTDLIENVSIDQQKLAEIAAERAAKKVVGEKNLTLVYFQTRESILAELNREVIGSIKKWLQELFCDLIAFELTGPMYIFIFMDFTLSLVNPKKLYSNYPPNELRLKFLLDFFEKSKYFPIIRKDEEFIPLYKLYNETKKYFEEFKPGLSKNSPEEVIYTAVKANFTHLQKAVKKIIKKLGIVSFEKDFKEEVIALVEKLKNLIVPCEIAIGKPANIKLIINAGKIFKITELKKTYNNLRGKMTDDFSTFEFKIDKLIMKGIELCAIQKKIMAKL